MSARLSGKVGGSSGRSQRQGSGGGGADEEEDGESASIVLTSENFSDVVLDAKETGKALFLGSLHVGCLLAPSSQTRI